MKSLLHLKVGQHLTLTPQLQQAIRLLQLSTFDLQQEIQNKIESNPMLESLPNDEDDVNLIENTAGFNDEFKDFQWSQLYSNPSKSRSFNEDGYEQLNSYSTSLSLQDYLRWQLELTPITNIDRVIAAAIIDSLNENGFMTCSTTELYNSLNSESYPLEFAEFEAVRHRIQHLDPIGCGARNLSEALVTQLEQLPANTPHLMLAKKIVNENITLLGKHNYQKLMTIYAINEAILDEVLHLILRLNPNPGSKINLSHQDYIIPDLSVKKIGNHWQVALNPHILPHLSINRYYASLVRRTQSGADNQFLKNNLQEARWFLKSIQSRQETLLKVACYIVNYQEEFLEFGEEAMKPLILNDVAHALNMHESTISRVTTQKFIYTPQGLFELKYFFSNHVPTVTGEACSSTAIRATIKKLIAAENPDKPLSDSQITDMMNEQGIKVARRTVAKYREEMSIAPSSARKSIRSKTTMEQTVHKVKH